LPLALGEAIRTIDRRKPDFIIWACFTASLLPLLFVPQLILSTAKNVGAFWAPPHWSNLGGFYNHLLDKTGAPVVAVLVTAMTIPRFLTLGRGEELQARKGDFSSDEIAAILGFIALPLFGLLLAEFVTKAFTDRYVLSAVLGISILFVQALHRLLGERVHIAIGIALLLLAYLGLRELRDISNTADGRNDLERSVTLLRSSNEQDLPIVIGDPHTFLLLSHYAPSDVKSHLVYLANPVLAGRILGTTSIENGMVQLVGPWFQMKVVPFDAFLASNSKFLLYGVDGAESWNWVNQGLSERRFSFEFLAVLGDKYLYSIAPPRKCARTWCRTTEATGRM
jgi:hypothetical protein